MIIVGNHPPSGPPTLTNVTIQNNYFDKGGGMSILNSDPILNYVSILENTAEEHGGGIFIEQSPIVTMNNVAVAGNSAPEGGGGIFIQTSLVTIDNATISKTEPRNFFRNFYVYNWRGVNNKPNYWRLHYR